MKKKGQGLSITTIIVAILAIVVLVVLIAVFTGRIALFQKGLGEAGKCTGTPSACESFNANKVGCQTTGCVFSDDDNTCTGSPKLCEGYTTKSPCETAGCLWQEEST